MTKHKLSIQETYNNKLEILEKEMKQLKLSDDINKELVERLQKEKEKIELEMVCVMIF